MKVWDAFKEKVFPSESELVKIASSWRAWRDEQMRRKNSREWALLAVALVVSCGFAWYAVDSPEFQKDDMKCASRQEPHSWSSDTSFAAVSRAKAQKPEAVHLFTIRPSRDLVLKTIPNPPPDPRCVSRQMLLLLIRAIVELDPAVIAIDQHYGKAGCGESFDKNFREALQNAMVTNSAGKRIPARFVYALSSKDATNEQEGESGSCLEQEESFDFGADATAPPDTPVNTQSAWQFYPSSGTLDSDMNQIPLSWRTHLSPSGRQGWRTNSVDTFALRAAELASRDVENDTVLRQLKSQGYNPFGRFFPLDQMRTPAVETDAVDLLCGSDLRAEFQQTWKHDCSEGGAWPANFHGRTVAVVGVLDTSDVHPFLNGHGYGVELQGQYIQALLTRSYFNVLPWNAERLAMMLVLAFTTLLAWLADEHIWQSLFITVVQFFLFAAVFLLLAALHYFPPHLWLSLAAALSPLPFLIIGLIGKEALGQHAKTKSQTAPPAAGEKLLEEGGKNATS